MKKAKYPERPILMVDDEEHAVKSFAIALRLAGMTNTITCNDSTQAMTLLRENQISVLLLDLIMPHVGGREILENVNLEFPEIPAIVLTGVDEIDSAVDCMRLGAFDYIVKPVQKDRLISSVQRALEMRHLRDENQGLARRFLNDTLEQPEAFNRFCTESPRLRKIFQYCEAIAKGSHPVLITGETGVGKDLIPQILHDLSGKPGQYVAVNVAGLDDNTFSDTLFGHAKGAFTGAEATRKGLIEQAAGGTLFLDEIGDLNAATQVKLLRLLEQREYFPLGSDAPKKTDARVIVATHKDLDADSRDGQFRKDLYYRLHTHHIQLPPLRERKEDIQVLLDRFLDQAAAEFSKKKPTYHPELLSLLNVYDFPGNVRELRAMVFDAVGKHSSKMLSSESFHEHITENSSTPVNLENQQADNQANWLSQLRELPTIKEATDLLVEEACRRANGNQSIAASLLGISRQALAKRLKRAES